MPMRPAVCALVKVVNALDRPHPHWSLTRRRAQAARSEVMFTRLFVRRAKVPLQVTDHAVAVPGGTITVRAYVPPGDSPLPAHLYIHGGAFWQGDLDSYDPLARWYAAAVGCVVLSVGYRLAPEHKYPTQLEDCYAALTWASEHATELGIDRISIGGVSAGGALAAGVALMARDRGGPQIVFQLLEIPATDCTLSQASINEFATGHLLTRAAMVEAVALYLADPTQAAETYASPLLAPDLSGLPPALILTAECDPLRDEGEAYGARLREAGVPTIVRRYAGHVHSSFYVTRLLPSSRRCVDEACASLRLAHEIAKVGQART